MQLEQYFKKQTSNASFKKLGQLLITNKIAKIIEIVLVFLGAFLIIKIFTTNETSGLLYNQMVIWFANIFMLAIVFTGIKLRGEGLSHFGFSFKKINCGDIIFRTKFVKCCNIYLLEIIQMVVKSSISPLIYTRPARSFYIIK